MKNTSSESSDSTRKSTWKPQEKDQNRKINKLFSEIFKRKEEITDLWRKHKTLSRELPSEIKEEIEQFQKENQSILELIEAKYTNIYQKIGTKEDILANSYP